MKIPKKIKVKVKDGVIDIRYPQGLEKGRTSEAPLIRKLISLVDIQALSIDETSFGAIMTGKHYKLFHLRSFEHEEDYEEKVEEIIQCWSEYAT